jgi:hypothetical protein
MRIDMNDEVGHRCADDPVPVGTAATMEQHVGHGVIRSGLEFGIAIEDIE